MQNILHVGWTADSFTNWLTQQAVNIPTKIANLGASAISTPKNLANSLSNTTLDLIGEFYSAKLLPSIEGGQNTGDVNFGAKNNNFRFRCMRIKEEYLRIVDNYFSRYGYKINRIKVPNVTGRRNFNYVEIGQSDEMLVGNVPFKFMQELNNTCRKGVTIWHNHANIGNYNVQNDII